MITIGDVWAVLVWVGLMMVLHGLARSVLDLIRRHDAATLEAMKRFHAETMTGVDHIAVHQQATELAVVSLSAVVEDLVDHAQVIDDWYSPCGYHSRGGP